MMVLFSARIITDSYYTENRRAVRFGAGLHRSGHPVGMTDFLNAHNLDGKVLNDLNSGSWLIWKAPQKVYIDGRLEVIKEDLFREYLDSFSEGGLKKLVDKYNAQMVIFDHAISMKWNFQLKKLPDWRLIHWDETSAIYARRDYRPGLAAVRFTDVVAKKGVNTVYNEKEVWEILRSPTRGAFLHWLTGFCIKEDYPYDLMKMGIFAYQNNEFRPAELLYLEFLKRTKGALYEIYFNLGSVYYRAQDFSKALYCYQRVLHEHPENTLARQRVKELISRPSGGRHRRPGNLA
jgi:tetratricopeptide (TPR) repeat protein